MASTLTSAWRARRRSRRWRWAPPTTSPSREASQIWAASIAIASELIDKIVALGERVDCRAPARPAPQPLASCAAAAPRDASRRPGCCGLDWRAAAPLQTFLAPIARQHRRPDPDRAAHARDLHDDLLPRSSAQSIGKPLPRSCGRRSASSPGAVLLAPGDFHMRVAGAQRGMILELDKGEPVNFCRPAADPLFETAAAAFGAAPAGRRSDWHGRGRPRRRRQDRRTPADA